MRIERARASDQIFDELRRRITERHWPDGAQLPTEKELAAQFDVSPNTIREAIRALSAVGLVDVRHGSGTYVSLSGTRMLSSTLGTVMQLENVSLADVLGLSRHLHDRIAELAVQRATADDLRELDDSVAEEMTADTAGNAARVQRFLDALAASAHDPLLAGMSWTLDRVVIDAVAATYRDHPEALLTELIAIRLLRKKIVDALNERNVEQMKAALSSYFDASEQLATQRSELTSVRLTENTWAGILSDLATGYTRPGRPTA